MVAHDTARSGLLAAARLRTPDAYASGVQSVCTSWGPQTPHAERHPPTAHASD